MPKTISKVELETLMKIRQDPVLWAKTHIVTYDGAQKKYVPWTARWYQAEMLRDQSRRKVYRCGRRTGSPVTGVPFQRELREGFFAKSNG